MIKKFIHIFWNFLFPQKCLGCGEENSALCRECLAKIGMPTAPKEDNIFSASDYGDEVVKKAIWMLKYRGAKNLAEPLACCPDSSFKKKEEGKRIQSGGTACHPTCRKNKNSRLRRCPCKNQRHARASFRKKQEREIEKS
jgi:hypothetical protein